MSKVSYGKLSLLDNRSLFLFILGIHFYALYFLLVHYSWKEGKLSCVLFRVVDYNKYLILIALRVLSYSAEVAGKVVSAILFELVLHFCQIAHFAPSVHPQHNTDSHGVRATIQTAEYTRLMLIEQTSTPCST